MTAKQDKNASQLLPHGQVNTLERTTAKHESNGIPLKSILTTTHIDSKPSTKLEQINPKTNTSPPNPHAQIKTLELHLVSKLVCIPQRPNLQRGHCFLVDGHWSDDKVINSPPPPLQLPRTRQRERRRKGQMNQTPASTLRLFPTQQSQNGSHTHFT